MCENEQQSIKQWQMKTRNVLDFSFFFLLVCFFNYKDLLKGESGNFGDFEFFFSFFFFCFFTYSEALPALRLRRVDIFGPPVGSALNNP